MSEQKPPQDPFEMFRRLWGPLGVPLPGMAMPTLDPQELDKRIADLRSGLYPMQLPQVAGNEGAGVVEAVGANVTDLKKGDRVAYTGLPGSYCEARVVPADRLVKIPEGITDEQAASMMLKGLTVHYLIHTTYPVKRGDTVLWHAAPRRAGMVAVPWPETLGVTVVGTV